MKKILFITHDDMDGGSARSLLDQILYLKNENEIEPIVITLCENSLSKFLQEKNVQTIPLKYDFTSVWSRNKFFHIIKRPCFRFFYNMFACWKLKRNIDLKDVALVVSNSSVIDFGAYLFRKCGVPHVWYLREFGDVDFNIKSYIRNFFSYMGANSSEFIAVSNAVAKYWIKRGLTRSPKVVYDGLNLSNNFNGKKVSREKINICMCGRLSPTKGQHVAIDAVSKLPVEFRKRINLDFWGVGESRKDLEKMIARQELSDCVKLCGFSDNLDEQLFEYDIGLNLSKSEAFGRTTVEYMSHGLFVICCNSGASPELLENNLCSKMIEVDSSDQLAEAIKDYMQRSDYYEKLASHSSLLAKRRFDVSVNAPKALEVYRKIWR